MNLTSQVMEQALRNLSGRLSRTTRLIVGGEKLKKKGIPGAEKALDFLDETQDQV